MTRAAAIAVLLACSPGLAPPAGYSLCGVALYGSSDVAGFRSAERIALETFEAEIRDVDMGGAAMEAQRFCHELYGWTLTIRETEWLNEQCQCMASGETDIINRAVYIVRKPSWGRSSYPHEQGHVAGAIFVPLRPGGHGTWDDGGYWDAIDHAAYSMRDAGI